MFSREPPRRTSPRTPGTSSRSPTPPPPSSRPAAVYAAARPPALGGIGMSAPGQDPGIGAADVYRGFIDAVNRQDLQEAARFVDAARYRENCVGFTRGFVDWEEAKKSVRQVWKGLPDLRVELDP